MNIQLLALLIFLLLVAILPVKSPCTLTIIARGAPLLLLIVAGHDGCCKIFGIWINRLLSHPFWNLNFGLVGWVPTRAISIWPAVFLGMAPFSTLATSHIWTERWNSPRATTIYTEEAPGTNLIQSLVDLLLNDHSVCLWKWRLVLRLLFSGGRFQLLWIHKIAVFSCSLLQKGLIGYELLLWYNIHVIHTKFLDKIRNFLVLLNILQAEPGARIILNYVSDVP